MNQLNALSNRVEYYGGNVEFKWLLVVVIEIMTTKTIAKSYEKLPTISSVRLKLE
jgi:hypothetical protein